MRARPPILSLAQAAARFVRPRSWVYLGNFGSVNFAAGHELIRQGIDDLWLVMSSGGILFDQLVGTGQVARAVIGHCWNPIGPGPAHAFRRAVEHGRPRPFELTEMTLGSLNLALMAGAHDWPFAPELALAGSGYAQTLGADRYARVESPFAPGERVGVVAPIRPDVAIVHAQLVDRWGNAQILGPRGEVSWAAFAADAVVVVAEEVVDDDVVLAHPERTVVPGVAVDAIVVEPWAAHPEGVYGHYERDIDHFAYYERESRDEAGLQAYLDRFVRGVADRAGYLRAVVDAGLGDPKRLDVRAGRS